MSLSWMAWTWQTAAFFGFIACALVCMGIWEWRRPGGSPRRGILGLDTTRGDRLFMTLLGSAFIHLAWLGLVGPTMGWAVAISIVYGICVFVWV